MIKHTFEKWLIPNPNVSLTANKCAHFMGCPLFIYIYIDINDERILFIESIQSQIIECDYGQIH